MGIRKTKDEFLYECYCEFMRQSENDPATFWTLVDGKFRTYSVDTKSFGGPDALFMPRRAVITHEWYFTDEAKFIYMKKLAGLDVRQLALITREQRLNINSRPDLVRPLNENLLLTDNAHLIIKYGLKFLVTVIPDYLHDEFELEDFKFVEQDVPAYHIHDNLYHLRHNA